jgi:hypothetical protein
MLSALCNRVAIERDGYTIGLYGDGGKEAKCILISIAVLGISLLSRVECLGNLFISGGRNVDIVWAKDDVVAEPVMCEVSKKSKRWWCEYMCKRSLSSSIESLTSRKTRVDR